MLGSQLLRCTRRVLIHSDFELLGLDEVDNFQALDSLPNKWIVILYDESEHWLLLSANRDLNRTVFFDPLGKRLCDYNAELSTDLSFLFGGVDELSEPVQSSSSRCCGFYVVFFAHILTQGLGLRSFLQVFHSPDPKLNDRKVTAWMRRKFPTLF